MDTVDRTAVLMDGPPPRTPERVHEGMVLRGRRVLVNDETGAWAGDLRAIDHPYWRDDDGPMGGNRWEYGQPVPAGCDQERARLTVAVCTEPDWYEWARTRRRPEVREFPAYLVWAE